MWAVCLLLVSTLLTSAVAGVVLDVTYVWTQLESTEVSVSIYEVRVNGVRHHCEK